MPTAHLSRSAAAQLETYFDRTAVEAWARLTSDAPVGRIRATVRAGRDRMRARCCRWLPDDLRGARVLDAGCGTGALVDRGGAARRARGRHRPLADAGRARARAHARATSAAGRDRVPRRRHARPDARPLRPRRRHGLADPLRARRHACARVAGLAARTDGSVALHLRAAHAGAGGHARRRPAVPAQRPRAGDRAGAAGRRCAGCSRRAGARRLADRRAAERVASGFYTSQALELRRA